MAWYTATEAEFSAWEANLAKGMSIYDAATDVGVTMSALGRYDPERKARAMEVAREVRAAKVDKRIDKLVEEDDPTAALVIAWAKANHPDYQDRTQVEISGRDGGPIEIEGRAVVGLADVVQFAKSIGQGHLLGLDAGDAGDALPAAEEVLPGARDGKPAAGILPAAEGA